jgi:hypothetical protein
MIVALVSLLSCPVTSPSLSAATFDLSLLDISSSSRGSHTLLRPYALSTALRPGISRRQYHYATRGASPASHSLNKVLCWAISIFTARGWQPCPISPHTHPCSCAGHRGERTHRRSARDSHNCSQIAHRFLGIDWERSDAPTTWRRGWRRRGWR